MNKLTVGYIAIFCMAAATTARAEADSEKRNHLFGEAVEFDVVNRFDVVSNRSGGIQRGTGTVNNLDARLMFDGEKLLGVHGSSMLLNVVSGLGGKPNSEYVGTFQGVDSNEVTTNTTKLYQAWIQQTLWNEQLSLLFGLYDLNAEFYATDSAGLFLHPGSGVGVELGQTGVNGPSISPTSSMAFRVKLQPSANWYAQAIVFDGVPGDPNNPARHTRSV